MLLVEENHAGSSTSTHTDNKMLEIGPVDVEDKASRCAMEAADGIKVESTEMMMIAIPYPLEIGIRRGMLVLWQKVLRYKLNIGRVG